MEQHPAEGQSVRQAVIGASIDGTIVFWNREATRLLGYEASDAIGASLDLVVPEEHRTAHWAGFHAAMAAPELRRLAADLPLRCADGEVRHLAGSLTVLIDGLGRSAGAIAVFRDDGTTGVRPFG